MSLDDLTGPRGTAPLNPEEYERRIAKLAKINAALMQRVERSMEQQANAFSLFQAAIGLEAQVRLRTGELKHALDQLEQSNADLTAARDASDRANRVKTRFFTAVGHDLLQPLHAARLSLSALGALPSGGGEARLLSQIDHALLTVEELLKTVLDLSRLESGGLTPKLEAVPVAPLFDGLAADLGPIAREKGLLLTSRANGLSIQTDALMVRRMLQNLLANAVRYTERGEIKLAARKRGALVRLEVWDTGPGIAPEERTRIFEEFQRGAASDRAGVSGFGLGLSIVQRMAETLGHRIDLCSRVGRGTRFSILAPAAASGAAAGDAAGIGATGSSLYPTLREAPPMLVPGAAALEGAGIIVIDNDMAILAAMDALLDGWGCDRRLARNLEDLEEVLTTPGFAASLIVADYHLDRGETGLQAVALVRKALRRRGLPAIVVTADHTPETDAEARAQGCEVMRKPIRPAELRALMTHLLAGR